MTLPCPSDRIVQTQSLSFIAGFHECWRGLNSGATLVLANSKVTGLGPDLEGWLRDNKITIMKAVPSLLRSMLVGDRPPRLPDMRLFHVGGEAVTQELVNIFGQERMFLNTYGSTESCSNCVIGFCAPGDKVCTIGDALPSFKAYVLEKPESTQESIVGELYIAGMSLALDYLNLPEKTKEVFIEHKKFGRLYNTGDCVERLENANIVYRGRKDNQTKINGYRVELGEVEAKMNMIEIVKESAAVVVDNALYTFISLAPGQTMTLEEFKKKLKDLALPFFAMPSRMKVIEEFPKTISGKLDRKVLVQQILEEKERAKNAGAGMDQGTVLGVIMSAFAQILQCEVKPEDDFFLLGGDSASAGQTVGMIRLKGEALGLKNVSILDLYTHRTPKALEAHLASNAAQGYVEDIFSFKRKPMQDSPNKRLFDIVTLVVALLLNCTNNMEVFFYFMIVWTSGFAVPVTNEAIVVMPKVAEIFTVAWQLFYVKMLFYAFWIVLTVFVKWTVVGRYREGRWAKFGPMHLRHWIVFRVSCNLPWRLIGGTGLNKWIMRALGAKVGRGTFTYFEPATGLPMNGYDLYELDDYSSICQGAYCSPIYFTDDSMVCGRIQLGRSSSLYPRSTVSGSIKLEEGAVLEPLSSATDGTVLGAWERWTGSPARPARRPGYDVDSIKPPKMSRVKEFMGTVAQVLDVFSGYYIVLCVSMIPRYGLLVYLSQGGDETKLTPGLFVAAVVMSVFFGSLALTFFSIFMVRLANLISPSRPGAYHIHSWTTLLLWHKVFWFKSPQLMINNTRFLQWFARACGMKLGAESHISIVRGCVPDLVTIGEHTFLANPCFLGVPVVHNSYYHVGTVEIGDNVLVGNNACFMVNTSVPSDTTIAVNTGAPPDDAEPGGIWVGYPPVRITDNNEAPFPEGSFFKRTLMLVSEVLIIFIPGTLWACCILSWLYIFVFGVLRPGWLPEIYILKLLIGAILLVPLRAFWAILGGLTARFILTGFSRTPEEKNVGYWDFLPFRWRIYNKLWAFFLIPMLLDDFSGSQWMNRLVNFLSMAEIEEDVLIVHHGLFKDHNYVRVRKGATINESVVLRTHTFEDWILKFGFVDIGPKTTVHPSSTIMFGCKTGEGCTVVSNTLVLKGDELADGTIVAGIPSLQVENREVDEEANAKDLATELNNEIEIWV
jgi:non-ribosomal peptide synthetase-like protein